MLVLPTAAAYQHPERTVLRAAEWFGPLGGQVEGLMVVDRAVAEDPAMAATVVARPASSTSRAAPRSTCASVLKESAVFEALREAWRRRCRGGRLGGGAMVLTDPMVDPRGGALTVGLGLVDKLAVVPHFGDEHDDAHGQKLHRSVALAPAGLPVVGSSGRTALIRDPDGSWRAEGGRDAGGLRGRRPGSEGLEALGG